MDPPAQRLKAWRAARGLSQKEASKLAGITQAAWCEYENGEKLPRVQQAVALAKLTAGDANAVTVEMFAEAERLRDAERRAASESGEHPAIDASATGTDPHTG